MYVPFLLHTSEVRLATDSAPPLLGPTDLCEQLITLFLDAGLRRGAGVMDLDH